MIRLIERRAAGAALSGGKLHRLGLLAFLLTVLPTAVAENASPPHRNTPGYFVNPFTVSPVDVVRCDIPGPKVVLNDASAPLIEIGARCDVTLRLVPRQADISSLLARISIEGPASSIEYVFPIDANTWQIGGSYDAVCPIIVPPFTHVGAGVMHVALVSPGHSGGDETQLYVSPVYAPPRVLESRIPDAQLSDRLGPNTQRLRTAFRLTPKDAVTLPVGNVLDHPCTGLAIVSTLRYSAAFRQGEPVFEIVALSKDGKSLGNVCGRAGETTSLAEYDAARPGVVTIRQAEVFGREAYTGVTWEGKPLTVYTYLGRLPFELPSKTDRLVFRNTSEHGALDVYEVALSFNPETSSRQERE